MLTLKGGGGGGGNTSDFGGDQEIWRGKGKKLAGNSPLNVNSKNDFKLT